MLKHTLTAFCFVVSSITVAQPIEYITSGSILNPTLCTGAIIRNETGFETDFLLLHCLLKKFNPKKIFEVGTCEGYGTLIMAHACPQSTIISLDLPPYTPPFFHQPSAIGWKCSRPYQQVYGNSVAYDYSQHFPLDAWFIDGAHDYDHVKHETQQAIAGNARLIIYHDTDIPEVLQAVIDSLEQTDYKVYRVTDSRISYAIKTHE